jgi:hypothetical protein
MNKETKMAKIIQLSRHRKEIEDKELCRLVKERELEDSYWGELATKIDKEGDFLSAEESEAFMQSILSKP